MTNQREKATANFIPTKARLKQAIVDYEINGATANRFIANWNTYKKFDVYLVNLPPMARKRNGKIQNGRRNRLMLGTTIKRINENPKALVTIESGGGLRFLDKVNRTSTNKEYPMAVAKTKLSATSIENLSKTFRLKVVDGDRESSTMGIVNLHKGSVKFTSSKYPEQSIDRNELDDLKLSLECTLKAVEHAKALFEENDAVNKS